MKLTNLMMKKVKGQEGFTLIELMIVVGIIGILVAIAAPNFARYQSKARQSEAKIALSAVYAGEKSFYSEYSAYATSNDAIGYTPEGNKRFYTVGFSGAHTTTVTGYSGALTGNPSFARVNYPAGWSQCVPNLNSMLGNAALDPQNFTAGASGEVRDGQTCDMWTINENKVLQNTTIAL